MKKYSLLLICLCTTLLLSAQNWTFTQLADMPESVSNNAVVSAEVNGKQYVYSFGGIDSTKLFSGIHNRCYRFDLIENSWEALPDLPDPMTKIATAASVVNGIAYVMGGYHVFSNGSELTREFVHRLDLATNTWLADGAPTPKPVDDQVQMVWQDSLIYLVTGWSGNQTSGTNVPDVQIYNPTEDTWSVATSVPNNSNYKVFGASGAIIDNDIYYFGGAKIIGFNFLPSTDLRRGIIDLNDPTSIEWSFVNINTTGYRQAATILNDQIYFLGGSDVTYNYNGIAYNGTGGVSPNESSLVYDPFLDNFRRLDDFPEMPMDLRGIGKISNTQRILAGGMEGNQKVSKKTWMLTWEEADVLTTTEPQTSKFYLSPNPLQSGDAITVFAEEAIVKSKIIIYSQVGQQLHKENWESGSQIKLSWRPQGAGIYFLRIGDRLEKIIVQ